MTMKSVTYIVKPAETTNPRRRTITLTVLDNLTLFPRYNSSVHIYRPPPPTAVCGGGAFFDSALLRESLSKVLVHYYPVAGRYRHNEAGAMEIDCNDEGVVFVHVDRDSDIDDIGELNPSSEFKSLVPTIDYTQQHVSSYPIMVVQATYFKCGGVSLAIAIEHSAVDGCSAFRLINSWAEVCRGVPISVPPYLDRELPLRPRDPPCPKFGHQEYTRYTLCKTNQTIETKISVLNLSRDQLVQMKAKAKDSNSDTNYSTFEILAGHTWKCVCKARQVSSDQKTRLMFQVNGRFNRLDPPLPPGFFGNAIFRALPTVGAGELQSKPLWFAAGKIREALARMDNEYLRSAIDFLAVHPDPSAAKIGPHIYEIPNFQLTSWARLGMNDADFGWGPPEYTGPGEIKYEKAYIFSGDNSGGMSVAISLRPQHMEKFEKLFYEFE